MEYIDKFYVAYAVRKHAMPDSIFTICDTYEEAEVLADDFLYDDADTRVWIYVDYIWYCVWGRDAMTGCLIVSKDEISDKKSYVSDWY